VNRYLAAYWDVMPSLRAELFSPLPADKATEIDTDTRRGNSRIAPPRMAPPRMSPTSRIAPNGTIDPAQIKAAIFEHPEFAAFKHRVAALFEDWKTAHAPLLRGLQPGDRPKALIDTLSEGLLDVFRPAPLLDPYDIYQRLMDYWDETLYDDAWMIALDGWRAMTNGSTGSAKPNIDLIPNPLVVARYFADEQAAIEQLETERDAITQELEELAEEDGGEDGLLDEAKNDKGKLTAKGIKDRLRDIKGEPDAAEERAVLERYLALADQESTASKQVKDAQKALDAKVATRYATLTEAEIKTLVVDDKWLATLEAAVHGEIDRVSQALTGRIKQLAERYATPLPQLADEVETLSARVKEHLKKMGFAW